MKNLAFISLLALAACHGSDGGNNASSSNAAADANITQNSEELNASAANVATMDQYENESNASADSAMNQMGANETGGTSSGG